MRVHNFKIALLVLLGGAIGSLSRYYLSEACYVHWGRHFPSGTLCVNLIGAFVMGVLWSKFSSHLTVRAFWMIGMLGGFTTFSTFSLDALLLLQHDRMIASIIYILASTLGSMIMVYLGYKIC